MYKLKGTPSFKKWLSDLDKFAAALVLARLHTVSKGSLGNWRSVGGGVAELKIDFGPGYRIYFTIRGNQLIILLFGGDKKSQKRDIAKAQELANLPIEDVEEILTGKKNEKFEG